MISRLPLPFTRYLRNAVDYYRMVRRQSDTGKTKPADAGMDAWIGQRCKHLRSTHAIDDKPSF